MPYENTQSPGDNKDNRKFNYYRSVQDKWGDDVFSFVVAPSSPDGPSEISIVKTDGERVVIGTVDFEREEDFEAFRSAINGYAANSRPLWENAGDAMPAFMGFVGQELSRLQHGAETAVEGQPVLRAEGPDLDMFPDGGDDYDCFAIPGVGDLEVKRPDDGEPYEMRLANADGTNMRIAVLGGKTPKAHAEFEAAKAKIENYLGSGMRLDSSVVVDGLKEFLEEHAQKS